MRLYFFLLIFLFAACSDDKTRGEGDPDGKIEIPEEQTPPSFTQSGGSSVLQFIAKMSWTAGVTETRSESWCTVYPMRGEAGTVNLTVRTEPNDTYAYRTATITLVAGKTTKTITVTQSQNNALVVDTVVYEVGVYGRQIDVVVRSNIDFTYEVRAADTSWIVPAETRALTTHRLKFGIKANYAPSSRKGQIFIHSEEVSDTVYVLQSGTHSVVIDKGDYLYVPWQGDTVDIRVRSAFNYDWTWTGMDAGGVPGWIEHLGYDDIDAVVRMHRMGIRRNETVSERCIGWALFTTDNHIMLDTLWIVQKGRSTTDGFLVPDPRFRSFLLNRNLIIVQGDSCYLTEDGRNVTSIYCDYFDINSLEGIKNFGNVRELGCRGNNLITLDLSGCTALTELRCEENKLTTLDVSGCTSLTLLRCSDNQLMGLDVSGCTALAELSCYKNNLTGLDLSACRTSLMWLTCGEDQSTTLDLSGFASLASLRCYGKNLIHIDLSGCSALTSIEGLLDNGYLPNNDPSSGSLVTLDLAGCSSLTELTCYNNQLARLDVSGCAALTKLSCHINKLTELDLSGCAALTSLSCDRNQLTALDLSACRTSLTELYCSDNQLTGLDLSGCTALTTLTCRENKLITLNLFGCSSLRSFQIFDNPLLTAIDFSGCTSIVAQSGHDYLYFPGCGALERLDFSGCTSLTKLSCGDNLITLDVSGCTALTELRCEENKLTTLDVSGCTSLTSLSCSQNQLARLDVSGCAALTKLFCDINKLTELDLSGCPALLELDCGKNQLTTLDFSACPELKKLYCNDNQLTNIDVTASLWLLECSMNRLRTIGFTDSRSLTHLYCSDNQLTDLNMPDWPSRLLELRCAGNRINRQIPDDAICFQSGRAGYDQKYFYRMNGDLDRTAEYGWWYDGEPKRGYHRK